MSSTPTPEIFESARTSSNKSSPIGSGINKSLLTPCRRIGLSRKRKTPSSTILKILSTEAESDSSMPERYSPLTPVHIEMSCSKRRTKVNYETSIPSLSKKKSFKVSHNNSISSSVSKERSVKKSLTKNFSEVSRSNTKLFLEDIDHSTCLSSVVDEIMVKEEQINCEEKVYSVKESLSREMSTENFYCQNKENKTNRSSKIIQLCEIYDSDDNFQINDKTVGKSKIKESSKKKQFSTGKKDKKSKSEDMMENLKDCKISIPKLMHDDINYLRNYNSNRISDSSDDELNEKVKKKRMIILSDDDEDFCKQETYKVESAAEGNIKSQNIECSSPKVFMGEATNLSTVFHISDEDDDFTSTPDQDRVQKKELLDKIKNLEVQVKEKRKKLENLKQASVYKSKHNIEELMKLVEQWKDGCVLGLNGLLTSLQNHGPMDMHRLLNNLHIPKDMVAKLCLNMQDNH